MFLLRLALLYTVLCSSPDVGQRVPMYPESVDASVSRVAMVTLDPEFDDVEGDGVFDAAYIGGLGVLNWKVLDRGTIGVVHVVAKVVGFGVHFTVETLEIEIGLQLNNI